MFASHFVAQTTLLGTRRSPNPPDKPFQNVAVLSQKRDWKCVHFGLLFWQDQAVCFVVGVEKLALYALSFFGCLSEKRGAYPKKQPLKVSGCFSFYYVVKN
ncbi:hypothetical protein [Vagococcus intermedius]|nr:hypothetical protein [Vagococcus intermedius]WEG76463.1 hypothetical protein OL235_10625 [Vagococcus intermedius]